MRRVISHGYHALDYSVNMKASSAYPVDSLRSGKFTQKYDCHNHYRLCTL